MLRRCGRGAAPSPSVRSRASPRTHVHTRAPARAPFSAAAKGTEPIAPARVPAGDALRDLITKREWPARERTWERTQRFARASGLVLSQIFQRENVTGLALAGLIVCGIGCAEGALLLNFPLHHPGLVFRYGLEQVFASLGRGSVPMELLIQNTGEKTIILRNLLDNTPSAASVKLQVDHLRTARSMIAGFVAFAQIIRCVNIILDGPKGWREQVRLGKEPLFGAVRGRVVRLAGIESDCTAWELGDGNDHIVPIFEDPVAVEPVVRRASRNLSRPVYYHAKISDYGRATTWEDFRVTREWLFPIEGSESRVLFLEADASVTNQSFSMSFGSFDEITLRHATEAFRLISRRAVKCGALTTQDKVVQVLLADGTTPITTGGGFTESLRTRITRLKDVDILIDSTRTLQRAILRWLAKATAEAGRKVVVDTDGSRDFQSLSALLKNEGYEVFDSEDPSATPAMPRLVYHTTTTRTVCAVALLLNNKKAEPSRVCALLDRHEGIPELKDLCEANGPQVQVPYLCAATIHSERFKAVRMLVRKGYPLDEVQRAVDEM